MINERINEFDMKLFFLKLKRLHELEHVSSKSMWNLFFAATALTSIG